MGDYIDLRPILRQMQDIQMQLSNEIDTVDVRVKEVDGNVKIINSKVEQLAEDFDNFVNMQTKANRLGQAETRLVKIRQELEKKYGHYDLVRRTTTGILQANDLGLVKKSTITNASEELMISTPGYWLAPCLVALAAWINDQRDLAYKALAEGIRRDDEKTSLFLALVCRRAGRKHASLQWVQRYLAAQDEENLNRNAVVILDAYASGLLGTDTEGTVSKQIDTWMGHLTAKPGFVEQQTKQWSDAINLKRTPITGDEGYRYLSRYSHTWPALKEVMEGARLHATILDYFNGIFAQKSSTDEVKAQLDEILTSLVTDFDDEELPLRRKERFEQFVVDYQGDEAKAKSSMTVEKTALEEHKDFTQLLTDSAMKPQVSHANPSTQKFAIALSRDWIRDAYNDIIAKNRAAVPHNIEINVDTFNYSTVDGSNEQETLQRFNALIDHEMNDALIALAMTPFEKFMLPGAIGLGVIALIGFVVGGGGLLLGVLCAIAGIFCGVKYYSANKREKEGQSRIRSDYETKRSEGTQIIRAMLAEVVDYRREFAKQDAQSAQVLAFIDSITPEQYVRKMPNSTRKVRVTTVPAAKA
ncbi:hypothetical protein [Bifidobacterium leontopitheci]|uniref:Uncharacterized protein n=1 Tax=Bifidobacterium leontopitheci TaxID=2650774 RepID=A0A6I1GFF5_9BIFI|nr:hypothetical protein [Bifidobacterium leontopitheci]KAB7790275.1 hypothetical protein F7D09_1171 [Bifidobacterium leontopitheci]